MRLASVRRSLFTNDDTRSTFLAHLMTGTREILQTGKGMFDVLYCGAFLCLSVNLSLKCYNCVQLCHLHYFFNSSCLKSSLSLMQSVNMSRSVRVNLYFIAYFTPHSSYFKL